MKFEDAVKTIKKYGYHLVRKSNSNKNVNESFASYCLITRMQGEKIMKSIFKKFVDNEAGINLLLTEYADEITDKVVHTLPKTQAEFDKIYTDLANSILEREGFDPEKPPRSFDDDKLEEAKRIITRNGLRFVKESKKYAGKHPVFSSKKFQDYLLKECGFNCVDDECYGTDHRECCDNQDVNICPDCGGDGCEHCNLKGYIEQDKYPNNIPEPIDYNEEVNERY